MEENNISIDQLMDEINALLEEKPEPAPQPEPAAQPAPAKIRHIGRGIAKLAIAILTTLVLLVVTLYGVMYVLAKGPSPTARDLFVRSVRETSAVGFLANLYFSEEEITQIIQGKDIAEYIETDTSLIQIPQPEPDKDTPQGPVAD